MEEIMKIKEIGLAKLNNPEYTFFMSSVASLVKTAGSSKLNIKAENFTAFGRNIEKMTDIVVQSNTSDETAVIAAVDKQADDLIVYLLGNFRNVKSSPVKTLREAALSLYNATKPYMGCQKLPQRQQIEKMRALLIDLSKPNAADNISVLGLGTVVDEISAVTTEYATLIESRAASQIASALEAGKTVRDEMDKQYDDLTTMAFVASIANPSAESAGFIVSLNKLIDDTNKAYNQRAAQRKK